MCVCLYYKAATPRQLLNEQHVLGLTRDIFTVCRRISSLLSLLLLLLLPVPALLHLLASSLAHIVPLLFVAVAFRLLYCIGACRMEIENCS